MKDEMQPPWVALPQIPHGSIGWRMGQGEEFYDCFYKWFSGLSHADRLRFAENWPEPPEWAGFYDTIASQPWRED
jgi:hypothetical protein